MKKITKSIIGLLMVAAVLTSCKKDTALSKTELLTKQPWKLTAYIQKDISTGVEQDNFAPMTACYKDDNYVYKPDMSYEGNAGVTKCSNTDPQVFQTGTWSFKNNETILERIITSGVGTGTIEFTVTSITATELKVHTIQGSNDHIFTYSH